MPKCIPLLAALFTLSAATALVEAQHGQTADELDRRCTEGVFGGAKTQPLAAKWEFSSDGGKTFGAIPATFPVNPKQSLTARATFSVVDPAAVAALWVIFDEPKGGKTPGAFATCGHENVGGGECGASPLWTHVAVTLNGKAPHGPLDGMMYTALPVQTAGLLARGDNTLTITGPMSAVAAKQVTLKPLQLIAGAPGKAVIRSGPILGHFGDDFFTVACRTGLPAAVTVTATPVEPPGAASMATSPTGFYHRLKVSLPKGTRKFTYTVTSNLGDAIDSKGPFTVSLPASDAKTLRVVTYGNSRGNYYSWTKASLYADGMLKCKPDIFVHLGQVMEFGAWDFQWDVYYLEKFAQLMATVPTYLAPDGGDHTGLTLKLFSTPASDEQNLTWTQAFGPARLIGIDGIWDWSRQSANAKWLEGVLKDSREKYILAFDHFPGYSTGQQSRPRGGSMWTPLQQCRDTICPLLGQYKATAIVSAFDYHYERVEPTPDKGVTTIIAGAGGAKTYRQSNRASANNPFAKTSVFREHTPSFVCFEISDKECVMKAYNLAGKVIDEKTFAPRQ